MGERWDDAEVENLRRAHEQAVHDRARAARDRLTGREQPDDDQPPGAVIDVNVAEAAAKWHVIHKPTAKTLCGQPNDGTKPAEGEPCNGCATAMYDVFGEVLDELEAERARVARVEALLAAEITDNTEARVRREVGDVRCLGCGLRYEERDQYGCHETGRAHSYDTDDLTDAEASARGEVVEYVTLAMDDLRAALAGGGS